MKSSLIRILMILAVLAAASIACNLPAQGSTTPPTQPPLSAEEAAQLENQLRATLDAAKASGEVVVNITQQQLTAFMAAELAKQPNQPFTDPQVVLTNGQVEVYGKVVQSGISADSKIVLKPQVNADGKPTLIISSMEIGPMPVPDAFKSQVQEMTDRLLSNYLTANQQNFKVKSITVTEGLMTVVGEPTQP